MWQNWFKKSLEKYLKYAHILLYSCCAKLDSEKKIFSFFEEK